MKQSSSLIVSKLKKIVFLSFLFMIVEFIGGYYAHSIAIFADAFHLLSDVMAYSISLIAVFMKSYPKPKILTFGFENVQPFGAFLNIVIIWFVTVQLFVQASNRIINKSIVQNPSYMLITAIFGLLCNLYILKILHNDEHAGHKNCHSHEMRQINSNKCKQNHSIKQQHVHQIPLNNKKCSQTNNIHSLEDSLIGTCTQKLNMDEYKSNINIKAAYIHIMTDIILSVGVIISATLIYFCAPSNIWSFWQLADPISTYLFSFLAIYSAFPILKQCTILLLNGCNNAPIIDQIENQLKISPIVKEIDSLKLWSTGQGSLYGAVRLRVTKGNRSGLSNIFASRKIDGFVHFIEEEEPLKHQ